MSRAGSLVLLTFLPFAAGATVAGEGASLAGRWKATVETDDREREYYVDFFDDDGKLSGDFVSPRSGRHPIKRASVTGKTVEIEVEREVDGNQVLFRIEAERTKEGHVDGAVVIDGNKVAAFFMRKLPEPAGSWRVTASAPGGERTFESELTIERSPKGYRGKMVSERGELELEGCSWKAEELVLDLVLPLRGDEVAIAIRVGFEGDDTLAGKWVATGTEYSGTWKAVREKKYELAGTWAAEASTDERSYTSRIDIAAKEGGYAAKYSGELGEIDYQRVALQGDAVTLELRAEIDGADVTFIVNAKFTGDGSLKGRWQVKDNEQFSGGWSAQRKATKKVAPVSFDGTWISSTMLPNGERIDFKVILTSEGERLAGKVDGPRGTFNLRDVKAEGNRISFTYDFKTDDGNAVRIDFRAELGKDGRLEGTWESDVGTTGTWSGGKEAVTRRL